MKAWSPDFPVCPIAESILDAHKRMGDAEQMRVLAREDYNFAKLEADRARGEVRDTANAYTDANSSIKELEEEIATLNSAVEARGRALRQLIDTAEEEVSDILHYTELYSMSAGKAAKMNKRLRQTLRQKRMHQDELALLLGAYHDVKGTETSNPNYANGSYTYHKERLSKTRSYHPKKITLAQALDLSEASSVAAPSRKLSRFAHIKSK